jgi:hypothetical protein
VTVSDLTPVERLSFSATRPRRRRQGQAALVLVCLSAFIAEALSGATPPVAFFGNPIALVYLTLYYGSAVLLVREMTLRWRKGWPTLLVLGGVWAIVQEGLGTKVFFDPTRVELGPLVNYGTLAGVHWAFVVQLIIYHTTYSVLIPIILTHVLFWSDRCTEWVGNPVLWVCVVLQLGMTFIAYQTISTFKPPIELYALTVLGTTALILAAWRLPGSIPQPPRDGQHVPHPRWFFIVGLLGSVGFFFVSLVLPGWTNAPLLVIALMIGITVATVRAIASHSGNGAWTARHQLALTIGALSPLMLLAPVHEMQGLTGASLVGIAAAGLLVWMSRRVKASA